MNLLEVNELKEIVGGINITGAIINSFLRGISVVLTLGRSLGTVIRRVKEGNVCEL